LIVAAMSMAVAAVRIRAAGVGLTFDVRSGFPLNRAQAR
jgi:hypothetical protein